MRFVFGALYIESPVIQDYRSCLEGILITLISIILLHNIGESLFASCWSIAIFNGSTLLTVCVCTERTYTVVIVVFLLFGLTVNGASFGI